MVRPSNFSFNPQTAESNAFQRDPGFGTEEINRRAREEFEKMLEELEKLDIDVEVIDEPPGTGTPDAVFPNNVFSTHPDGTICIYPMEAPARRRERAITVPRLKGSRYQKCLDLSGFESKDMFLEGTGSLVLDQEHKIAFACISSRTSPALVDTWCERMSYEAFTFSACDRNGNPIYHTNVMMCLGGEFAVACLESIVDMDERTRFIEKIRQTDRELIEISFDQMYAFAGNMLEISSRGGIRTLVMSKTAKRSLVPEQIEKLSAYARIADFDIGTIETCGGGSVRCMIAELF
ncbi:MAG: arginine deiminase-related protein [Acidobacteriota bacterium]|nr:arginine deiminase-related protein [Acidobacteriota bacterium]MDH3528375.1 arginine deiminase-related protein [Acidobacteriota bacterium]